MMNERLKKYLDPVKNFWMNLKSGTRKIILISLGGAVLIAVVLAMLMNRTQYTVLYPGLDHDEAVEVMTELKNRGVSYKEDDGTIYVPTDQENSLRMDLSNEGHPKTAPNYDFFTSNVNAMTTDDERQIIEKYQLQQRLEAVIKTLDPVDTAFVTISVPEKSGYVVNTSDEQATASVTVKLKEGKTMNAGQVAGIKQLVSKSVPNLTADNVSVINDSSGEELSSSSNANEDNAGSQQIDMTEFKLKVEKEYENEIESKITNLLSNSFGKGNVSASVKSQMDLDKRIQDIVTYKPTTSDGKGVISESNTQHETTTPTTSSNGGVAGTQSNANGGTTTYPGVTVSGNSIVTKDNASYKYLVSQVEEQIQSDAASLQDLTVSVIINSNESMAPAQKQDLTDAVANAAGVNSQKVKLVVNVLSSSAQPTNATPTGVKLPVNGIILIAGGSVLLLGAALAVLLVLKKRRKRAEALVERLGQDGAVDYEGLAQEPGVAEAIIGSEAGFQEGNEGQQGEVEENMPPKESIQQIRDSQTNKEEQVKQDLQEFSSQNPEIAAQLIRSWLKGENDRG